MQLISVISPAEYLKLLTSGMSVKDKPRRTDTISFGHRTWSKKFYKVTETVAEKFKLL
jgi:hypothetical protein